MSKPAPFSTIGQTPGTGGFTQQSTFNFSKPTQSTFGQTTQAFNLGTWYNILIFPLGNSDLCIFSKVY